MTRCARSLVWFAAVASGASAGCALPDPAGSPADRIPPGVLPDTQPPRTWRELDTLATFNAGAMVLLTDGTVMIQQLDAVQWWKLTPDVNGSYSAGTLTHLASAPPGYSPLYDASAVLPDGRVIVEGGEYIAGSMVFTTRGAIYDPIADSWQEVQPPLGWSSIGDASGVVLENGTFMLSDCCTTHLALLDANTLSWSDTGANKRDENDEESWAMLYDGTILTIDANNTADLTQAERYIPSTGTWDDAGQTPVEICDLDAAGNGSHEVGPNILRYDDTVLSIGGNGHNVFFDPTTGIWTQAPDLPAPAGEGQLDVADGPAAVMPNGDVLFFASPGVFNPPVHAYEWSGGNFTEITAPAMSQNNTTYSNFMLVLPTGEILVSNFTKNIRIYTPAPGVVANAVPVITSIVEHDSQATAHEVTVPHVAGATDRGAPGEIAERLPLMTMYLGHTYEVTGTQLNGLTQGSYYGDDNQASTNYPIIRLTNVATNHVAYGRTYAHSTRSIAPGTVVTTALDIPATAERGPSNLVVVANGIASPPVLVNIK